MWLGVYHDWVCLIEDETLNLIKHYKLSDWNFYHLPNALMIGSSFLTSIRLTTSSSYTIYALI